MSRLPGPAKWAIAISAALVVAVGLLIVSQVMGLAQAYMCLKAGTFNIGARNYETAERQFTRGLKLLPDGEKNKDGFSAQTRRELYLGRSKAMEQLDRPEEGMDDLNAAIALGDLQQETHEWRVYRLIGLEKYDEAVTAVRESAKLMPGSPFWHVEETRALWLKKDFTAAIGACDSGLKLFPTNIDLVEMKIDLLDVAGRAEEGLRLVDEILGKFTDLDDQARLWVLRSELQWGLGRWEESIAAASEAIRLAPREPDGYRRRYMARMEARRYEEALEDCGRYLDLSNLEPEEDAFVMGYAQLEAGQYADAIASLTIAATTHYDHDIRAYAALYRWYAAALTGEPAKANSELNAILKSLSRSDNSAWVEKLSDICQTPAKEKAILAPYLRQPVDQQEESSRQNACEAFFFAGARRVVEGDIAAARPYFEKSRETKCTRFIEYDLAGGELHRLFSQTVK